MNDSVTQPLYPNRLKAGDTVALVASAFHAADEQLIENATKRIRSLGVEVIYNDVIKERYGYFAGSDQARADDLHNMFRNPDVKAIFQLRGGWGCNRLLPLLDFELIEKHPKIIVGYSDITSLLLAIYAKTGLITFHGPMGKEHWPDMTVDYIKRVLFTSENTLFQNENIITINPGKAQGKILGGNLSVITSLLGSEYLPSWEKTILFLEDINEPIYKIDRMLNQLKLAGILQQISGFIFGKYQSPYISETEDNQFSLMDIFDHHIKPLNIPAWYGALACHDPHMFTLPLGANVAIEASKGHIQLILANT